MFSLDRCYLIWENSAQPFPKNRLVQATPKFQVLLKVQARNSILEQITGQKSAEWSYYTNMLRTFSYQRTGATRIGAERGEASEHGDSNDGGDGDDDMMAMTMMVVM